MRGRVLIAGGAAWAVLGCAGGAVAQAADWNGWQVGADIGLSGGRSSDIAFDVDPALDERFTYLQTPNGVRFDRERNLDRGTAVGVRAARLFQSDRWVIGVEGRIEAGGAEQAFVLGPVEADPVRGDGPGTLGGLYASSDTLTADVSFKTSASLRLRAGVPVGDRILVSAFAGPAWTQADLSLVQDSTFSSLYVVLVPGFHFNYFYQTFESSTSTAPTESAFGVTGGVIVDAALTERWSLRAEAGLTKFNTLEAQAPGGPQGGASRFSIAPLLYSASIGLSYRF